MPSSSTLNTILGVNLSQIILIESFDGMCISLGGEQNTRRVLVSFKLKIQSSSALPSKTVQLTLCVYTPALTLYSSATPFGTDRMIRFGVNTSETVLPSASFAVILAGRECFVPSVTPFTVKPNLPSAAFLGVASPVTSSP